MFSFPHGCFLYRKPVDPSTEATYKKLRNEIGRLQEEKAVAQSKMEQMELEKCMETEAFIKERDELQAEVTKLQRMIEDLKIQVRETLHGMCDCHGRKKWVTRYFFKFSISAR